MPKSKPADSGRGLAVSNLRESQKVQSWASEKKWLLWIQQYFFRYLIDS